jgi:hypothetical protein
MKELIAKEKNLLKLFQSFKNASYTKNVSLQNNILASFMIGKRVIMIAMKTH